jgi:ATP-dependent Clp protease ATP-binding subunit ClpA
MPTALRLFVSLIIFTQITSITASAAGAEGYDKEVPSHVKMAYETFWNYANEEASKRPPNMAPTAALNLSVFMTDLALDDIDTGKANPIQFREEAKARVLDILLRHGGKFPIVIGEPGAGKSAVIEDIARDIVTETLPDARRYQLLNETVMFRTPARNFRPGAGDMLAYINEIRNMGRILHKKVMIVFNECQFLDDYMVSVLRSEADQPEPMPIILEVDSKSYGTKLKDHPSFTSIAEPVMVRELNKEQLVPVLREFADRYIASAYRMKLSDDIINNVIELGPDYRRDVAEPRRSLLLLEDFAISQHRKSAEGEGGRANRLDLYKFVAKQTGLPVIPQNEEEFSRYMQGLRERVKAKVIGQDIMVDGLVNQFTAALKSRSRQHTVALLLGPTGVGKSLVPEVMAEEFYGDKTRYLELDMTQYKEAHSLSSLFGANNGIISSDKEKGRLCDFFDGPGKGGGIVVMNEIEEMNAEALTKFMEIFDKGFVTGGDGKVRYIGKTMFVMTSNKNSDKILSYEAIKGMTQSELDRRLRSITQDQLKKAFTEKTSFTEDPNKTVKPAVLERIDGLYFASPHLKENAIKITQLEVDRYVKDYQKQTSAKLTVEPSVASVFTNAFYNESLGSRQLRNAVQQYLTQATEQFKEKYGYKAKEITISAELHPMMRTVSYVTVEDNSGNVLKIDGPKVPVENRMLDPEFRERLVNLNKNMKKDIFGQDEAIDILTASVTSLYMTGSKEDTVAGFLLGVTGSGKSEMAKSLAKHLYGSPKAVGMFDMGKVQHQSDMGTIFSPGKGIIGSDQPGELEQFLTEYPDGGVLLFDEMSNAGGPDKSLKNSIAKQFYTMLNEGYYKSPSGKKFSVTNHVIIFTGNDGEEEFKGLSSDSLLDETYKELMKQPNYVKKLLQKAGFSAAFIGRLSFSTMMRPTLNTIKILIAKKMLDEWKAKVQAKQPIDIVYSEEFIEEIGKLMFSPLTGARSIKEFVTQVAGGLVGEEALKANWDHLISTGERLQIKIGAQVVHPKGPFYEGDEPDKREAILTAETTLGKQVVSRGSMDFTKSASFAAQAHIDQAIAVAHHEMGHAVTSYPEITGKKLVKITIIPEQIGDSLSAAGYAQYREGHRKGLPGWDYLVHLVAGLLGGSEAETNFVDLGKADDVMSKRSAGRSNDLMKVGLIVRKMLLESSLMPELDAARAYMTPEGVVIGDGKLPADLQTKFDDYVVKAIEDGRKRAKETLIEKDKIVQAGVKFLLKYGTIKEKEYDKLVELYEKTKGKTGKEGEIDFEQIRIPDECETVLNKSA